MTWEEMLQKHEQELADFEKAKKEDWEHIRSLGTPDDLAQQFNDKYNEDYKTLVANTYKEASTMLEKEQQDKAHLKYLQEQAKKFPEVEYWQNRIDQIQEERRQARQQEIAAIFNKGKEKEQDIGR